MPKVRSTKRKAPASGRKTRKPAPPKVFLSHASEDKERFVMNFATRLRERGVDVWLDRWEMLPGDSLVEKIFEEGLAKADAIIVVISKHSIAKRWVREELNTAVVRKINKSSKLIPVIIDKCQIPECLLATIWEQIEDLESYEPSLNRIVMSIFGQSAKPPLGKGPVFSAKAIITIADLTPVDSLVLQTACEMCLQRNDHSCCHFRGEELIKKTRELGISDAAVWDSVDVLVPRGYLKIHEGPPFLMDPEPSASPPKPVDGGRIQVVNPYGEAQGALQVTFVGVDVYLKAHRPDYEKLLKKFASLVVNKRLWKGREIEKAMQIPEVIVEHIVNVFEERKWIVWQRYGDGRWEIAAGGVSPELKRWLEAD